MASAVLTNVARQRQFAAIALALSLLPTAALAQKDRIAGPIDSRRVVALKGNVSPNARPEFDQGPVDPSRKLSSITLMLEPSALQQKALDQLLKDQQDPLSPRYHHWLTPEQYADRFGLSRADISKIVAWLKAEGFSVDDVARGRNWIVFSGTVAGVQNAFHTQIHSYLVDGETHFANPTEPSIPRALQPLVIGIQGLNDFRPKPPGGGPRKIIPRKVAGAAAPDLTTNSGANFLAPDDLAIIYDLTPLFQANIDGRGQTLVVAGQTNIDPNDIASFRKLFNLPGNQLQIMKVPSSVDPGITGDLIEADLDLEWSGAVARNANIIFVYASNVFNSVQYAVSQNLAPVISFSYGHCELGLSGTDAQGAQAVAQQANAQGTTWIVSSGDSGAAGCDRQGQSPLAQKGLATNIFASIPEVTGVGGTQFNEAGGAYWSNSNSPNGASALGYVPEMAWNESGPNGLGSSGGGLSIFYPQPTWQNGPGVPNVNARASPDVALTAAGHDGYIIVSGGNVTAIGGTSAAAPSFAGMVTLLNQYQVSNGFQAQAGQGNLNPNLYRMAQNSTGIFHDITLGDNIVPCAPATPDCSTGAYGYSAGPGYDPVTGLGSVDGNNLITNWNTQVVNTTTTVSANPSSFGLNGSTQLTATVTPVGSSGTPAGTVAFNFGTQALGTATLSRSGGSATATLTVYGSQLASGNVTIQAAYSGSSNFSGSSGTVTLTVNVPTQNSAIVPDITPNPVFEEQPDADGYSWFYTIRLTEVAGTGTTLTGFSIDSTDHTADIENFFGSSAIPALGTLSAELRTRGLTVPTVRVFRFSGMDGNGHQWSQQFSAPFYGYQITGSMALSSVPGTVRQDPGASQDCQWLQHLGLEEQNGHRVQLTKFLAGGFDLTSQIKDFFGSTTLPALGSLLAGVCWSGVSPLPQTISYEIDGTDDSGTSILATTTAQFEASGPGGPLTTSLNAISLNVSGESMAVEENIDVNLNPNTQWTVSVFPSNRKTRWLTAFPLSGAGTTTLTVIADSTGLAGGDYKATLVFQSTDTLPQFVDVPVTFTVGSSGQTPVVAAVVSGASFAPGGVVPGEIASIFGTNLTTAVGINLASGLPLPNTLLDVTVLVDGSPVPIFAVDNVNGQQQINFQVPWEVAGEQTASIVVANTSGTSAPVNAVVAALPGIFAYGVSGQLFGAILHSNYQLADGNHPVSAGETILVYCTGLGPVVSPPGDGAPASGQTTHGIPTVTIGGLSAHVSFSGLAPNYVGLNQINVKVPSGLAPGNQPVVVVIDGATSNTVLLPVR